MKQQKGKRGDDARLGVKTDGEQTVKEEEVEEFFAILRRIRVAVEYFNKGDSKGGRDSTEKRWRPSFRKEDFEGVDGGSSGGKRERSLDLNSDPPI
ncbi:protein NIM1-INTERACTING 2-like [Tripterygium wilfordii]|uniref:Protein NIM1-INTERACTING 2-like n=1 Tax=Tripterygium wilfordii TaxID=458696 RepID=A0A7J7DFX7_TRIWF|nr:protein NIM1-INTERACTING 2-like [Tripterygium wilfordii]